jgi:predicted negative regulator of RcsB-dependent stress response
MEPIKKNYKKSKRRYKMKNMKNIAIGIIIILAIIIGYKAMQRHQERHQNVSIQGKTPAPVAAKEKDTEVTDVATAHAANEAGE